MRKLKEEAAKHLGYVGMTTFAFIGLNWINELLFSQLEQSNGINWVFIPAGIRLLATLCLGFAGFEGILFAGIYLNFFHFDFQSDFRAWSGALAGALGPYLASLYAKHWFDLRARLKGLTAQRLLVTGLLCGVMSPVFHHTFMWIPTGVVDWPALTAMMIGDTLGILIVLFIAKGMMALADRYDPANYLIRRWRH